MKKYKHIYFDLDRTIWDFEGNAFHTLRCIREKFALLHIEEDEFHRVFCYYNEQHWQMFREGRIKKVDLRNERFIKTLEKFGIHDAMLAEQMSEEYLRIGPTQTGLIPFAREILEELEKQYFLYIITNGFDDVQTNKLKSSGIYQYFRKIITSEQAHSSKPKRGIFEYALTIVNAKKQECLMVGDDLEIDILGAKAFGIDQAYFNPSGLEHIEAVTYEINSLLELRKILL